MKLIELFRQTYSEEDSQFILQRAPPHYSTCIKHHYYIELQTFIYQSSLAKESFDKSIEPKYGLIKRSWEQVEHNEKMDCSTTYQVLRKLAEIITEKWKQQYVGIDYVMNETDSRIDIIDFNYNPAFSDIEMSRQRNGVEYYFNEKLVEKIKLQEGIDVPSLVDFSPEKMILIQQGRIQLRFGVINREFVILSTYSTSG